MSWYTEEEIEKLLEDEELRKRIARFVTMSGEEFFDEVYTHLSPEELEEYLEEAGVRVIMVRDALEEGKISKTL